MDVTFDQLHWSHLGAALAHGIQSSYTFALGNTLYKNDGVYTVTNQVVRPKPGTNESIDKTENVGSFRLVNMVGVFPALSMINHLWAFFDRTRYEQYVMDGKNPARWIEYSVSASIMFNIISILSAQTDIKVLTSQYFANIALQFIGYIIEEEVSKKNYRTGLSLEIIGSLIFLSIWTPIMISFFTSVTTSDENPPDTVWIIIFIMSFLMISFALLSIMYLRSAAKKSQFVVANFKNVELGYIILSFVSKTFLTNMTLFGALFSTRQ